VFLIAIIYFLSRTNAIDVYTFSGFFYESISSTALQSSLKLFFTTVRWLNHPEISG